ncbi:MAG: ABC transporter permease subunit [Chitinivibrionales bacterium]|nr:ABC transporter permease subunit [Chitinivibrionales bacterium]
MLRTIIAKEFAAYVRDGRFLACTALMLVLFTVAGRVSVGRYHLQRETASVLANARHTHPRYHGRFHLWSYVYANIWSYGRPTQPMQILVSGSEQHADHRVAIEFWRMPYYMGDFLMDPLRRLFGALDFVVVTGMVVGLLVFLMAHDTISRELESGTLRVLLAAPVPRDTIVLGKLLGGLLAVLTPYVVSVLLLLVTITFDPSLTLGTTDITRMLLLLPVGGLYVAGMFAVAAMASVWTRSSGLSALVLLVLWGLQVIVLPGLGPSIAHLTFSEIAAGDVNAEGEHLGYVDSRTRLEQWSAEQFDGRWFDQLNARERDAFDRYQYDLVEQDVGQLLRLSDQYTRQRRREDRFTTWVNRVSLYGALQNACMSLANTGPSHDHALARYNNRYQGRMLRFVLESSRESFGDINASDAPEYRYLPPSTATCVERAFPDVAILCVMAVLAFLLAYLGFLRMPLV